MLFFQGLGLGFRVTEKMKEVLFQKGLEGVSRLLVVAGLRLASMC